MNFNFNFNFLEKKMADFLEELRNLLDKFSNNTIKNNDEIVENKNNDNFLTHPMLGKKCIIRTYSAGVHFGKVVWINKENCMECKLEDAYRLWEWTNGGLSLSAINQNGLFGGRINYTGEVFLSNAIEYIPMTNNFENSFQGFVEDRPKK